MIECILLIERILFDNGMVQMNSELLCHYLFLDVCVRCFFSWYIWHIIEHPRSIAIKRKEEEEGAEDEEEEKEHTINVRLMVVCWMVLIRSHYCPLSYGFISQFCRTFLYLPPFHSDFMYERK